MVVMRTLTALVACTLALPAVSQESQPTSRALEKALLLEEMEHDARGAADAYALIARDETQPAALRGRAWYHLGRVLGELDDSDGARAALEVAVQIEGPHADQARALLQMPELTRANSPASAQTGQSAATEVANSEPAQRTDIQSA